MLVTYLLRLQLLLQDSLPLMQPTKPINLLLILATDFIVLATSGSFVGARELRGLCVSFDACFFFCRGGLRGTSSVCAWWDGEACYGTSYPPCRGYRLGEGLTMRGWIMVVLLQRELMYGK